MMHMTFLARLGVAFAAGFALLFPSPVFAGSQEVTTVTLPPAPTLTVPTLSVPQLPVSGTSGSSTGGSGSLTVPTIAVPQLQVPTISAPQLQVPQLQVPPITVPQLQVPELQVPQLQVPSLTAPPLVAPELPAITVPQSVEITSTPTVSTPRRNRTSQGSAQSAPSNVTPQATGLISPEMLLEMLRVQEDATAVELVAPQEATTTNRLPIGTFAAFGGGVALVSFALSLLRRRNDERSPAEAAETV